MSYSDIIRDAFWIAWRNRFLWFFGFFVSGAAGSIVTPSNFANMGASNAPAMGGMPPWLLDLAYWIRDNVVLFVVLATTLVLLVVTVWLVLYAISRGALAESVAARDRGEARRFSSAWRAGLSSFWRVIGQVTIISLFWFGLTLVIFALGALLFVGISAATESIAVKVLAGALGTLLLLPLLAAIFVVLLVISQFALRALVLGGEGVFASIGTGYRLFRTNTGTSLLLLLIQVGIALAVGGVVFATISLAGLLLSVPVTFLSSSGLGAASTAVAVVLGLIFSAPFVVITSAAGVFHQAYWTLVYLRLTHSNRPQAPTDPY